MNDKEFRAMLQASRQRNNTTPTLTQTTPPATNYPSSPRKNAKALTEVIRAALRHETVYMPTRKSKRTLLKIIWLWALILTSNYQAKIEDILLDSVERRDKYNKNYFIF